MPLNDIARTFFLLPILGSNDTRFEYPEPTPNKNEEPQLKDRHPPAISTITQPTKVMVYAIHAMIIHSFYPDAHLYNARSKRHCALYL